jgi:hypothetical protein
MAKRALIGAVAGVVIGFVAIPARAQFDPAHNHLKCYKIAGPAIKKKVLADNQFGTELIVKLTPQLLCVPTQKSCCANPPNTPGCQPTGCAPDPSLNQPAPADHFKCYKIMAKVCLDPPTCNQLERFNNKTFAVHLEDQFGSQDVDVGNPQLLCAPVLKVVTRPTTTTTTGLPTTTTTGVPTTTTTTSTTSTTNPPPVCDNGFPCGNCGNGICRLRCGPDPQHHTCEPTCVRDVALGECRSDGDCASGQICLAVAGVGCPGGCDLPGLLAVCGAPCED